MRGLSPKTKIKLNENILHGGDEGNNKNYQKERNSPSSKGECSICRKLYSFMNTLADIFIIPGKLLDEEIKETGNPDNCEHAFCVECILEWSRKQNTCPNCRRPFKKIIRYSADNIKLGTYSVESKKQSVDNYTTDSIANNSYSSEDNDLSPESESNFIRL